MTTNFPRESRHCSVCGNCRTAQCERSDCGLASPAERVKAYLERRKQARGIDTEAIHSFDQSPDNGYALLASDIEAILATSPLVGGDVLTTIHCQEFHEIAMDYRGAGFATVSRAYQALCDYIEERIIAALRNSAPSASPASTTELNAMRWLFTMEQQEAQGEKPQAFMAMFRKVRDENRSTPTRAEYEAATDAAMVETGFMPASAQPVSQHTWRVGEFWSSSCPGNIVLMLARSAAEIACHEEHKSFIRWIDSAAPEPVSQPVVAVPVLKLLEEAARAWNNEDESGLDRAMERIEIYLISGRATPLAAPVEQDKQDAARYRVLRKHVAPRDVTISMRIPFEDIPPNQTICERIDMLCDQELKNANGEAAP